MKRSWRSQPGTSRVVMVAAVIVVEVSSRERVSVIIVVEAALDVV